MSVSLQSDRVAPRAIAGGYVLVPAGQLLLAWRACRRAPLGAGDFRTWLACREMLARRCTLEGGRPATYGFVELSRLTGVSSRRARGSVGRLVGAGLLTWSDRAIEFPEPAAPDDDGLAETIGGGGGSLAIPRRMLRLLVDGGRPALIATALAMLLRCLSRGRGGFKSRGRVKAAWIARVFGVDLRRVKQARKELIALGWLIPEGSDQWAMNRWGRPYLIDLAWGRAAPPAEGAQLPPPPAGAGPRLPPPDLHPEPPEGGRDQEPDPGGPAGIEIRGAGQRPISSPDRPGTPAGDPPRVPAAGVRESAPRRVETVGEGARAPRGRAEPGRSGTPRPAKGIDEAAGGPLPAPRLEDVRAEDLEDTGRLLALLAQAIARDRVGSSEADRLRFVAAAEHAMGVGKGNPPGLFAHLIRGRLWRHLTQGDEERASTRLKRHLFGGPRGGGGLRPPSAEAPGLSTDAVLVGEVRAASIRAGYFRDPFPAFRARNPDWTPERWERALAELDRSRRKA